MCNAESDIVLSDYISFQERVMWFEILLFLKKVYNVFFFEGTIFIIPANAL